MSALCGTPYDAWIARRTGSDPSRPLNLQTLRRYQLARLNDVLALARAHSPFYQRHLAAHAPRLDNLAQLERLPFTTPDDIRRHGLQMLCLSQRAISHAVTLETSGTTGPPKRLFFTEKEQARTLEIFAVSLSQIVRPGDAAAILLPAARPGGVGDLLCRAVLALDAVPVRFGLVSRLPEALEALRTHAVTCAVGVPVQLLALARYHAAHHKRPPLCLRHVLLCTDRASPPLREAIERVWNCHVITYYGMTESGFGGGMECPARCGYHLQEADFYIELIDPLTGLPVEEGRQGEITVTTLSRGGMPLIRYRTGDLSRFLPGACPCGSALRRLDIIPSRITESVRLGASGLLAMADLDAALFPLESVINVSARLIPDAPGNLLEIDLLTLDGSMPVQAAEEAVTGIAAVGDALRAGELRLRLTATPAGDTIAASAAKRRIVTNL